jgi:hypothetical protein
MQNVKPFTRACGVYGAEPHKCTLKNAKIPILVIISVVLLASLPSLVFALIQSAEVLPAPDLTLTPSDIVFSPENPVIGQPVNITAIVHNIGTDTAENVTVDFYVDSIPIVQKVIDELSPDSQKNVSINFIFLSVGYHNVTVDIDASNIILEANEANNQATKYIPVAEIQTEPCSISLTAYPELIEANGFDTSTITAIVTDELGKRVSGTNVSFSTTLGTIDSPKSTSQGIATTTLTSSLLAGTAVIEARAVVNDTSISAIIPVDCVKTAEAKCDAMWVDITIRIEKAIGGTTLIVAHTNVTVTNGVITVDTTPEKAAAIEGNATANSIIYLLIEDWELEITLKDDAIAMNGTVTGTISKITLNTPPEFYITSKSEVGVATTDLDVEFNARFTPANLELTLTLLEQYNNLKYFVPASGSKITENIIAAFGIEGVTPSDIQRNTAILVHSELSGTFIANNVTAVPISIRVKKEWFDSVAEGDINKVTLFKISDNGEVDEALRPEVTIDSINDTATFCEALDHFCVLALVAQPSKPLPQLPPSRPSGGAGGGGGYYYPYFPPAPLRDTTPPVISNITVIIGPSVTIVWETNEMSDSLVKCGRESGHYTIEKADPNYVLFHSIRLEEINEYATYYFVINSTDYSGNSAQTDEYIFIFTPPSKAGPFVKIILPSISYYIITFWWIVLVAVIPAFIISFVIYKRYRARKERALKAALRAVEGQMGELKESVEKFKKFRDRVSAKIKEEKDRDKDDDGSADDSDNSK